MTLSRQIGIKRRRLGPNKYPLYSGVSPRVILLRTKNSANVGSAARAMKNFGLSELVLVAPRCRLDRHAYALASHAAEVLEHALIVPDLDEALADRTLVVGTTARPRNSQGFASLTPRQAMTELLTSDIAFVFGPEDTGLGNAELDRCQRVLRIPTAAYASLNLAQAVVVVAYEWFLAHGVVESTPVEKRAVAPRSEIEAMYTQLLETLHYLGYTDQQRAGAAEHLFRRFLDRAALDAREVAALRGLFSQARWAADQPPERLPHRRRRR